MNSKTLIVGIIYTPNLPEEKIYIISNNEDSIFLPQIDLSSLDIKKDNIEINSLLETLFNKYVDIDYGWLKPKLLNIEISHDNTNIITAIYYGIYIPSNTILKNGYWTDIAPYVSYYDTLRKLLCVL